jgi:hypothetical protein
MAFDELNPHLVLAREEFVGLVADEHTARILASQLFTEGWAACEIRRARNGKIVGLDPVDVTTLMTMKSARGEITYEQRIGDRSTLIDGDKLMVIRLDEPVAALRATR